MYIFIVRIDVFRISRDNIRNYKIIRKYIYDNTFRINQLLSKFLFISIS